MITKAPVVCENIATNLQQNGPTYCLWEHNQKCYMQEHAGVGRHDTICFNHSIMVDFD